MFGNHAIIQADSECLEVGRDDMSIIKEILKEVVLSVMVALSAYTQPSVPPTALDPASFSSEIGVIDQLVADYNTYKNHVFHYRQMTQAEQGYRVVYQREDGVQADFLFRKDESLKEFRIFAYTEAGKKLCDEGVDVGSMLAFSIFQYSLAPANHYDLMKLFSDWNQNQTVTLEDPNLGALRITQSKGAHVITMQLPKQRAEIVGKPF